MNTNKKLVLAISVVGITIFFIIVLSLYSGNQDGNYVFTQKQMPTPTNIEKPYSHLNQLRPGKSSYANVDYYAGKPTYVKKVGEKTYLYYNTPISDLKNTVLMVNNVVYYTYEHVFGDYRGTYDNFLKNYGAPDFVLYANSGPWYVFLSSGVMVQSNNNIILNVVYFLPEGKEKFYKNVAADLGLSTDNLKDNTGEAFPTPQPE